MAGKVLEWGDVAIAHRDLWGTVFTAVVLLAFLGFFRFTRYGLVMRATALDQEAALAQGISARLVHRLAWGIAGMVAALAGTIFAAGSGLQPGIGLVALAAFPAMILGGLDSPLGAVVGGIAIGVVQQLAQLLSADYFDWAGSSVEFVVPYVRHGRHPAGAALRAVRHPRGAAGVTAAVLARRRARGGNPHRSLAFDYADDLRLFPGRWAQVGLVGLVVLYLVLPGFELMGDPGLRTMVSVGIFAIGALGLNLLTGYTGQVSLGHAFFFGVGSYTAGYLGATHGWPLELYLPAAAALGFLIGAAIGPFALRLRGNYLVIVTLGLLFVGRHVFNNWDTVTGGNRGTPPARRRHDGGARSTWTTSCSSAGSTAGPRRCSGWSGRWWRSSAVLAKNLVRSRAGRAMQAVRDRDLSAEVIGVHLARYKVGAFAWSSAFACVAGVLNGVLIRQAGPDNFGLLLSITYIAIIIIGGAGTILGSLLGALFVIGGRELISQRSSSSLLDPILTTGSGDSGWFTVGELNNVLFGVFIVLFLLLEPRGLVALWLRVKTWFRSWPFSY